jgi:hypothetical protein
MELFSKRKKQPPKKLVYDIPEVARTRILVIFKDFCYEHHGGFGKLLEDVGKALLKEYGFLCQSGYIAARRSDNPIIEHFYYCDTEQALDFVELCFQQNVYDGYQKGVDEINRIFNEYGIGFELTPFVEHKVVKETSIFGGAKRAGIVIEYEYPRIIEKSSQLTHQEIVQPSMELLSDSRFRVANSEMLKAHTALRNGDYEDAITLCGSAFESVLKTIIDFKGWNYSSTDTCAKLIGICRDNNLFPTFYCSAFEAVGTIRNKLSDAHGRGPKKTDNVTKETAEHMVHMTLTHMVFLAKCAGIKK